MFSEKDIEFLEAATAAMRAIGLRLASDQNSKLKSISITDLHVSIFLVTSTIYWYYPFVMCECVDIISHVQKLIIVVTYSCLLYTSRCV